jgi:hypothetical protein
MRVLGATLFASLLLSGCGTTPYVAYEHKSDPGIEGDGWDLGCGGLKYRGRLSAKAGYCWNARGGNMLEARVEYDLFGEQQ